MGLFYNIEYYYIFILTFLFIICTFNLNYFIKSKDDYEVDDVEELNYNKSAIVFINFKIILFFSILYCCILSHNVEKLDLIYINKFFFVILFVFLLFFEKYTHLLKMQNFEFAFLFMFSTFCLLLILQCDNFLNFYVILESYTLLFCSILLLKKFKKKNVESSFYYLVLNLISSLILLFSISYIYLSTGLINFVDLNQCFIMYDLFKFKNFLNYGFFLFMLAIFIKLTIFPFSLFIFEIYRNFNNGYVLFLLTIPKFIVILFTTYITNFLFVIIDIKIYFLFLFFVLFTALVHSIYSVVFLNFKDIIINVSLSNSPFLFFVLFSKSAFFLTNFINFAFLYFFNLFCFFSIIFVFCLNKNKTIKKITELTSLFYTNISLFLILILNLLSLCSLPPFSNFFAKLFILYTLIDNKMFYMYLFLSFINLIIIYCYIRIIKLFFIKKENMALKYVKIEKSLLVYFVVFVSLINLLYIFVFDLIYMFFFNSIHYSIFF